MDNCLVVSIKTKIGKKKKMPQFPQFYASYITDRKEKIGARNVHSNKICKQKKLETMYISVNNTRGE